MADEREIQELQDGLRNYFNPPAPAVMVPGLLCPEDEAALANPSTHPARRERLEATKQRRFDEIMAKPAHELTDEEQAWLRASVKRWEQASGR